MLDNFTRKLAEKMGRTVKESVQPIVKETSQKVDSKVDLYSRILRLGVLIFLFIEGTKKVTNTLSDPATPNQIVINNYLCRKEDDK